MAIDPYAPCPGGTGKKLKFCCSDLVGDLEQIDRLVEGNQLSAARDMVARLSETHPGRACLLATKVKLDLSDRRIADATATAAAFVAACPENPLAMAQAALCDSLAGRLQEAATAFDRAREACGAEVPSEVVKIAVTLVQVAAQFGASGFSQGLLDWIEEKRLLKDEESRMLAASVGTAGVPAALRTRPAFQPAGPDSPWRFEFDRGLDQAKAFKLSKALTTFRSLKGVAGESHELFNNIGILCEMLARPFEAAEAWLKVASLSDIPRDDGVEMTGRAIALEQEADPDRSPTVPLVRFIAELGDVQPEQIELAEDKLRHDRRFQPVSFDRSEWVSKGLVPPRSVWRVGETIGDEDRPQRLLASLLIFGRQTDRGPYAVLQAFEPDAIEAKPIVEPLLDATFGRETTGEAGAVSTPTAWLTNAQYLVRLPDAVPARPAPGEPSVVDTLMERQRGLLWDRFVDRWPDTALPELLGKTPRESIAKPEGRRRVEAMIEEGEAASRWPDAAKAWSRVRERLGISPPPMIKPAGSIAEVPPMRWHRLDLANVSLEELRMLLVSGLATGFETAAERAAHEILSRNDASPEDRWEALSLLEERSESTVRKLEIIGELRSVAATLKVSDGMIDVAELRARLQRGDEADIMRLLDHVGREHGRDQKVIRAVAEVLAEAGIDLSALAGRGGPPAAGAAAAAVPPVAAAQPGKLWTPDAAAAPAPRTEAGGEKKTIWTPG